MEMYEATTNFIRNAAESAASGKPTTNPIAQNRYYVQPAGDYLEIAPTGSHLDDRQRRGLSISVPLDDVRAAWTIVADEAMRNQVHARVGQQGILPELTGAVSPEAHFLPPPTPEEASNPLDIRNRRGVQQTIAGLQGTPIKIDIPEGVDPKLILQRIEQRLAEAGIKPGPAPAAQTTVGGSNYIHFSNNDAQHFSSLQIAPAARPAPSEPLPGLTAEELENRRSMSLLSAESITRTSKGDYIGTKATARELATLTTSLEKMGFKRDVDFTIKPSSLNNGNNVIAFTSDASAERFRTAQADWKETLKKLKPEQADLDESALRARQQLADPSHKPIDPNKPSTNQVQPDINLDVLAREEVDSARREGRRPPPKPASKPTPAAPETPHKPGTPHVHAPRVSAGGVAGLAVTAVATMAAAQNAAAAENKPVGIGHVATAAVNNFLPVTAVRQGRYAEAFAQAVERIDPTMGVAANGLRDILRKLGRDVDQGALSESVRAGGSAGILKDTQWNERLRREQNFLMSNDHPGQLASLKMKDDKGRDADICAMMKDPKQCMTVLGEIRRREQEAQTPEAKKLFVEMREAAIQYMELESRRRDIPVLAAGQPQNVVGNNPKPPAHS